MRKRILDNEEWGQPQRETSEKTPTPEEPERSETQRGNALQYEQSAMNRAVAWWEGGLKLEADTCY